MPGAIALGHWKAIIDSDHTCSKSEDIRNKKTVRLESQQDLAPKFQFVDCAQGGQVAIVTSRAQSKYWSVAEERLSAAGVTARRCRWHG